MTHDCLIVGGGIIGLSLAYELAGHGMSVGLLDRRQPGREASWAGAGILPPANPETASDPLEQLRGLSHLLHPQWAAALREETGIDTGYRRCGGIYVAQSVGEAASLHAFAMTLADLQITAEPLSRQRLVEMEPALATLAGDGLRAAYLLPDEAQLRNPHHLQALLEACRRRSVDVYGDAAVHDFDLSRGRVSRVRTERGEFTAAKVCVTSGAWTQRLLRDLGISTGILPIRGQMVLFRCDEVPFRRILNEGPRYLVPRDDGRVLVGSSEEEAGFEKCTTEEVLGELRTLAVELVPQLAAARIEKTWAGLRPGSLDGFPYLGRVPGLDNLFVAAGHYRSGLHMSTGTAVVLGQLIRGERPEINIEAFRVGRG